MLINKSLTIQYIYTKHTRNSIISSFLIISYILVLVNRHDWSKFKLQLTDVFNIIWQYNQFRSVIPLFIKPIVIFSKFGTLLEKKKKRKHVNGEIHKISIPGLPYIRLIPKVTAVAGETLRLKCPVAGYPIEEIKWERANHELPDDLRQKVLTDGTLMVSSVQKKGDAGVYTCWARNKQGHSARRSGDVAVIGKVSLWIFYTNPIVAVDQQRQWLIDDDLEIRWILRSDYIPGISAYTGWDYQYVNYHGKLSEDKLQAHERNKQRELVNSF